MESKNVENAQEDLKKKQTKKNYWKWNRYPSALKDTANWGNDDQRMQLKKSLTVQATKLSWWKMCKRLIQVARRRELKGILLL